MEDLLQMQFTLRQVNEMSNLALAHIGDGAYELLCRAHLCLKGNRTVKTLHKDTIEMVKAPTQARMAEILLPHLTQEEQDFFRRGKNAHTHAAPKSATPQEYARATGLEALFGALFLMGKTQRMNELFQIGIQEI